MIDNPGRFKDEDGTGRSRDAKDDQEDSPGDEVLATGQGARGRMVRPWRHAKEKSRARFIALPVAKSRGKVFDFLQNCGTCVSVGHRRSGGWSCLTSVVANCPVVSSAFSSLCYDGLIATHMLAHAYRCWLLHVHLSHLGSRKPHLLVVDAIEQFRAEDGRQDASNDLLILICYYPGGIFSRERVLNPELIRPLKVEGQDWESRQAPFKHVLTFLAADWASNLPAVVEPGNRRLSRFNRKAHKKIKKDRKMKTLPDLSANVDDELDPPKNILMVMIDDMGLDGTPEADLNPDAVRVGNEEAGPSEAVMEVQTEEPPSSSLGDPSSRWREEASVDDLPVNDPPANENVPIVDPPSVGDDPALIFRNEKIRTGANGPLLISDTSGVDQNEESSKGPSGLSPEDMEESTKDGAKYPAEPSLRTEGDGAFNTED
ncbi:hypothetical protein F2Q68_00010496 [Brassica cretica]|uniref:Uncharacterized protein n=1 Tax=Brassica cretica TaxID=69181 RepID=A0A8S9KW17_BRACR|nr:hypothetical protein F2Q68_00010496 [Brassica cretica]